VFIYGKTPKTTRRKYLKLFEERKLQCLIGGKILKRGLDIKGGVDNLIICGGGRLWSDYEQKIGRALRVNEKGWARVFGFLFLNNYYLYRHGRSQLKAVVDMKYPTSVIFNDVTVDGEQFVRSRFRKPKPKL
jgi:superfamily II DNA or RNA helicase